MRAAAALALLAWIATAAAQDPIGEPDAETYRLARESLQFERARADILEAQRKALADELALKLILGALVELEIERERELRSELLRAWAAVVRAKAGEPYWPEPGTGWHEVHKP